MRSLNQIFLSDLDLSVPLMLLSPQEAASTRKTRHSTNRSVILTFCDCCLAHLHVITQDLGKNRFVSTATGARSLTPPASPEPAVLTELGLAEGTLSSSSASSLAGDHGRGQTASAIRSGLWSPEQSASYNLGEGYRGVAAYQIRFRRRSCMICELCDAVLGEGRPPFRNVPCLALMQFSSIALDWAISLKKMRNIALSLIFLAGTALTRQFLPRREDCCKIQIWRKRGSRKVEYSCRIRLM